MPGRGAPATVNVDVAAALSFWSRLEYWYSGQGQGIDPELDKVVLVKLVPSRYDADGNGRPGRKGAELIMSCNYCKTQISIYLF
jgi:hypothetical protein